jgi:CheY-like chemotaxis protein
MRTFGSILVVDDDRLFLETYRESLSEDGYSVATASSREETLDQLDQGEWDVVLLDQKLLGPGGPDEGIELVEEVKARCPEAETIIITAYATPESIERAFSAGVYDFLEKRGHFHHLLRMKVRSAVEAVRERILGSLRDEESESRIQALWATLSDENDPNKKGLVLEELMALLLRSIAGFRVGKLRRRSQDEEIDIVVRNESHQWRKESMFILVECKNWSEPVGPDDYDRFYRKLERRYGRAKLGFFIAAAGFTRGFKESQRIDSTKELLVVCVGPDELERLVKANDRSELLKELHERAIIEGNGNSG